MEGKNGETEEEVLAVTPPWAIAESQGLWHTRIHMPCVYVCACVRMRVLEGWGVYSPFIRSGVHLLIKLFFSLITTIFWSENTTCLDTAAVLVLYSTYLLQFFFFFSFFWQQPKRNYSRLQMLPMLV